MYIRRKVFSTVIDENGEEKYFSTNEIINEEDYLEEVMYSGEPSNEELVKDLNNRKYKRNNTVGYGVAGAGLGLATGAATVSTSKKFRQAKSLIDKVDIGPNAKITRNNWWGTSVQGSPRNFDRLRKISHVKNGIVRRGLLGGAAIGAATLGTLGYLRGRYKANKRENRRTAVLNKMQ